MTIAPRTFDRSCPHLLRTLPTLSVVRHPCLVVSGPLLGRDSNNHWPITRGERSGGVTSRFRLGSTPRLAVACGFQHQLTGRIELAKSHPVSVEELSPCRSSSPKASKSVNRLSLR